jgi:mRNA-degrading endonuclease HigB of HigAB toxin-antitoxin module
MRGGEMSTNPVVRVERVIDTKNGIRRPLEFLHTKALKDISVSHGSALEESGEWHIEISNSEFNLNHFPVVILPFSLETAAIYKNVFIVDNDGPKLRLVAAVQPTQSFIIPTILLFETTNTAPIQGLLNSEGSGGGEFDWVYDEDKVSVFGEYLANLGNIEGQLEQQRNQLRSFIQTLNNRINTQELSAKIIQANTISADKLQVVGRNLITRFDSFEQYANQPILGPSEGIDLSTPPGVVVNEELALHGNNYLKMIKASGFTTSYKYINPFANAIGGWIAIPETGRYTLSGYIRNNSELNAKIGIELRRETSESSISKLLALSDFITNTDGWVRISATVPDNAEDFLIRNELLSLRIIIQADLATEFEVDIDAIQLEKGATLTDFSLSGRILIEGGNIESDSITTDQLTAGSITAGKIAANAVTAGTIAAGAVTAGTIAANAVTAETVAAGAITAGKIAAGSIIAGDGIIESLDAGVISTGTLNTSAIVLSDTEEALVVTAGNLSVGFFSEEEEEEPVYFKAVELGKVDVIPDEGEPFTFYGILVRDKNNTTILDSNGITDIGITSALAKIPDDAEAVLTGAVIRENTIEGKTLIAGTISAREIAAGSITTEKMEADSIDARVIRAGSIEVSKLHPDVGKEIVLDGNTKIQSLTDQLTGIQTVLTVDNEGVKIQGIYEENQEVNATILLTVNDDLPRIELKSNANQSVAIIESNNITVDNITVASTAVIGQHKITRLETTNGPLTVFQQV